MKAKAHKPLIAFMAMLIVFLLALYDIPEYVMAVRSYQWPKVEGIVQAITIDGKDYPQGTAIRWEINYAYKVFGKGYLGNRIKFQQPVRWVEEDSRYLLEHYDKDKSASVYFDPQHPQESCLIAAPSLSTLISKLSLYLILATIIYLSIYPQLPVEKAETEEEKVEALAERT